MNVHIYDVIRLPKRAILSCSLLWTFAFVLGMTVYGRGVGPEPTEDHRASIR